MKAAFWQFAISVSTPVFVWLFAKLLPKVPRSWLPIVAPAVGLLLSLLLNWLGDQNFGWYDGAAAGLIGVGIREVFNQQVTKRLQAEDPKRPSIPLSAVLLLLCFTMGCSFIAGSSKSRKSSQTAEHVATAHNLQVSKVLEDQPSPKIDVSGSSNVVYVTTAPRRVTVDMQSTGDTQTDATEAWFAKYSRHIPLGVSLILCAVGMLLLLYAWKVVRKSSATIDVAYQATDEILARKIQEWRRAAQSTTSAEDMAYFNAEIADVEAARGKLHSARPKKK